MGNYRNILIPVDGSARAERILPMVHQLSQVLPAALTLVRVISPNASNLDELNAHRYLSQLARRLPHTRGLHHRVLRGDPAPEILGLSERSDASYLAISTHGRSGITRWLMGSVAQALVHNARIPVIVQNGQASSLAMARDGDRGPADFSLLTLGWRVSDNAWPPRAILDGGPILVPLDGSALADGVIPIACDLAERMGRNLHLVEVVTPFVTAGPLPPATGTCRDQALAVAPDDRGTLNTPSTRLRSAGWAASAELRLGLPAEEILDAAAEQRASLIAMATHGRTDGSRAVLGSIADTVVRQATRPVLLLGPAAIGH